MNQGVASSIRIPVNPGTHALPVSYKYGLTHCFRRCISAAMYEQQPISKTLTSSDGISRLRQLLDSADFPTRTAAARGVCAEFKFYNPSGDIRLSSCRSALGKLEAKGLVSLPAPKRSGGGGPRGLGRPVAAAVGVPDRVDRIADLRLERVCDVAGRRLWTELVAREHFLGATTFAGCQARYLIVSEHGYLGAIGYSAAAYALEDRDRWIGWDAETRLRRSNLVVNLSRFLIRPGFVCKNLASKVLSMSLRRLPADFEARYGFRPALAETFVGPEHEGVCFSASNWVRIGSTKGRGRFAEPGCQVAVKSIHAYPLAANWRAMMGGKVARIEPLCAGEGLDSDTWADNEFGGASLGDVRLSNRLVKCAATQALAPTASFPEAAGAGKADVMGYYRLIDHPDTTRVTPENILAPHRERTLRRMQQAKTVLCIQDGSDLNFATHGRCRDLELIGKNRGSAGTLGLHMHTMLVVDGNGVPLGVPHIEYGSPQKNAQLGTERPPRKTERWMRGLRACSAMASELRGVRPVSVMDREADVFEIFAEQHRLGNIDIIVRAKNNRRLVRGHPKLFDMVGAQPALETIEIAVARRSARRAAGSQRRQELRPARTAHAKLRWKEVTLPPPNGATNRQTPVTMTILHLLEETPPEDGGKPLEWLLLTTLPVKSAKQARKILEFYALRWRIEDYFKIVKSGCKVEHLNHRTADRIERAVTINAVIAWRIAAMTLLGRETPELDASVMFSDYELSALEVFAKPRNLDPPHDLAAAILIMAIMGGYLNRKNAPPPGHKIIWRGYTRLTNYAAAFEMLDKFHGGSGYLRNIRSNPPQCVKTGLMYKG